MSEKEYKKPRFLQTADEGGATAAERGTATHQFMQFCDYRALGDGGNDAASRIDAEISRLRDGHFLSEETVRRIDRRALAQFLHSRLFRRLRYADVLQREVRFNLFVSASELPGYNGREERILVQGIIDCYYISSDGRVVLVDYKTDHFPRSMLSDRGAVERVLCERYREQLRLYRAAAEQLLCRPVDDVRIYSFALGDDFSVM